MVDQHRWKRKLAVVSADSGDAAEPQHQVRHAAPGSSSSTRPLNSGLLDTFPTGTAAISDGSLLGLGPCSPEVGVISRFDPALLHV